MRMHTGKTLNRKNSCKVLTTSVTSKSTEILKGIKKETIPGCIYEFNYW